MTVSADAIIRRLEPRDLGAALAIQAECYAEFLQEDPEAFASRLFVTPSYCLAAVQDDVLVGYLLAHGWASQSPPAVGTVLPRRALQDVLYIHDLAVQAAGRGLGRRLFDRAVAMARVDDLVRAELIAVEGKADYWRRLGFDEAACPPSLAAKVQGYGLGARWMTRDLS